MAVVNGAPKGATRTTMFGQPAYPRYSGASGVAHSQPPSGGAPNYSAAQLAQMYNNANAESTNPQHVYYSSGSSGNLQVSTSPSAAQASSTASTASPSKVSITESPSGSGANQLPGWVAAELQSGKISSYTNSSTGQTWYAPGALGSEPEYQSIWLSGPGYSGPVQSSNGNLYINKDGTTIPVTTTQTTEISENGKALYNGPSTTAPWLSFGSNGKFEGTQNVLPTSAPPAPNTQLQPFTMSSGTVYLPDSMMVNGVMVTGKWSQNADGTFSFSPSTYDFSNFGTSLTLTNPTLAELESYNIPQSQAKNILQGANTITLSINPTTGGMSSTGQYNAPTLTQAQLNAIINSGMLEPAVLSEMNPTATLTIGGNEYTGNQLIALYNSLYNQNYSAQTPQAFWNAAATGLPSSYASAPVTAPTFTTASIPYTGSPTIVLPQGWYTDSKGNLYVNGQYVNGQWTNGQAPTSAQSQQYANAYSQYSAWYKANNPNPQQSTNTKTASKKTPLQDIESWFGKNIINPVENAGKDIENLWNYYPVTNGPGQALGTYTFNTPVQNLKYNVSTKQEWTETSVPGLYINPATNEYWNSNNYEIDGFQPMNKLPPNVATPSSLFNQYITRPFEQNVVQPVEQAYLSYLLSRASQSLSQPTLSGLQPAGNQAYHLPTGISRTIAENAPELLLESLMPQARQSPSTSEAIPENEIAYNLLNQYLQANINKYSSPSAPGNTYWGTNSAGQPVYEYFNPSLWANRLAQLGLGIPGMAQNYGRGLIGSLEAVPSALFGTHYPNIPAAPSYETAPTEKYLSATAPNYISNFVNAGVGGANPGEGIPVLNQLANIENVVAPGIANNFPQSIAYLGSPKQTPLGTAYNTLFLGSSALMPGSSYMYGLGSGAINTAANWLFGSPQTPQQAFQGGYQFGAATAPLFEGAQLLGAAAEKFLVPSAREILFMASQTSDPVEQESLLKILQLVTDHPQLAGMARYLLRTAPVNSVFGALQAGEAYLGGIRNPSELLASFGLGYGFGTGLEFAGSGIGSAIGSLSTAARNALSKMGIIAPVEVNVEMGNVPGVLAMLKELPDNKDLIYNLIDRSIGRFGIDTTPLKDLSIDDLKSIIAKNPQFFLDVSSIAQTDLPVNVLLKDISSEKVPIDKVSSILRMMNIDTTDMSESAQRDLLISKLKIGDVPKYLLTRGFTLANTFDFLPQDIKANLLNAAQDPSGDVLIHLTSTPDIIKGSTISIDVTQNPTFARSVTMSGLSKYSSAPGAETTALGYAQYANPFAEETEGSIPSTELRGSRYYGQVEPFNFYPKDWSERVDFANQYYPKALDYLSKTYSPSGLPTELRNFDFFYTMQAAHDGLHIQTPVPEYYGAGELETGTPATGKLIQGNKFDIITVRPNQGIFKDTPFEKLFPTFVRGTYRTAYLTPESWDDVAKALKDSKNPAIHQEFEAVRTSNLVDALEHKTPIIRDAGRGIITDSEENIYLIHEVGRPTFSLPGGGIKDGEDPLAATTREVSEELKVTPSPKSDEPIVKDYLGSQKNLLHLGSPI